MTTIGVLGGGQLGRMMALAGYPLGLRLRFLDPAVDAPAGEVAEHLIGEYDDHGALEWFAEGMDAITYEFENVPVEAARYLSERVALFPPPEALMVSQERVAEKSFFRDLGIPTAPFAPISTREELDSALAEIGLPVVLKTCRLGYDGKGQAVIRDPSATNAAWEALGGQPLILEGSIPFERELSIISVRDLKGNVSFYPLIENHHREGILRLSLAPAPKFTPELQIQAEAYATRIMEALGYVGVLAVELFQVGGKLLANEMAPRVHNSGHWTIEGAETSQFENHLRAVAGFPLGSTRPIGCSAMLNLIGTLPDRESVLSVTGAHLHLYGKVPRPGRKLGHLTVRADSRDVLQERLEALKAVVGYSSNR
jgi:5-(carboxyamino)imidazole ribonucleotide synthase